MRSLPNAALMPTLDNSAIQTTTIRHRTVNCRLAYGDLCFACQAVWGSDDTGADLVPARTRDGVTLSSVPLLAIRLDAGLADGGEFGFLQLKESISVLGISDLVRALYLPKGRVRKSLIGPYRGIRYELSAPMRERAEVYFRAYEPNVTRWLRRIVEPGMTIFVVGAHLGIHALLVAKLLRGRGCVYAFEGWPENYRLLKANITCNPRLVNLVCPVHLAVGMSTGIARMTAGTSDGRHHLSRPSDPSHIQTAVKISTLDDFCSANAVSPDVVLMDIEGFEIEALRGAGRMLASCRPRLVLEHHRNIDTLTEWLVARGYVLDAVDRRHLFAR